MWHHDLHVDRPGASPIPARTVGATCVTVNGRAALSRPTQRSRRSASRTRPADSRDAGRNDANTATKFSRDCLGVILDVAGKELTVYASHFKSMMGGRGETGARREEQARRVAEIITGQWRPKDWRGNSVVLGDLNDDVDDDAPLTPLL